MDETAPDPGRLFAVAVGFDEATGFSGGSLVLANHQPTSAPTRMTATVTAIVLLTMTARAIAVMLRWTS